jgi:hypothetical protein
MFLGSTKPFTYSKRTGELLRGSSWSEHESDHSHQFRADIKNNCSQISIPYHQVHKDNFICSLQTNDSAFIRQEMSVYSALFTVISSVDYCYNSTGYRDRPMAAELLYGRAADRPPHGHQKLRMLASFLNARIFTTPPRNRTAGLCATSSDCRCIYRCGPRLVTDGTTACTTWQQGSRTET